MSKNNPYLPSDFDDNIKNMLPPDHPMNERTLLTPLQSFAYPILMWFFDKDRNLGEGRSYLMAVVCLDLAMRGKKIHLWDCSLMPGMSDHYGVHRAFINTIVTVMKTDKYKNHIFQINQTDNILIYKGRRPE